MNLTTLSVDQKNDAFRPALPRVNDAVSRETSSRISILAARSLSDVKCDQGILSIASCASPISCCLWPFVPPGRLLPLLRRSSATFLGSSQTANNKISGRKDKCTSKSCQDRSIAELGFLAHQFAGLSKVILAPSIGPTEYPQQIM